MEFILVGMTHEEIKELADLARLELSEEDVANYKKDFEGILNYIDSINTIEIESQNEHLRGNTTNRMRSDDEAYSSGAFTEVLLEAAPSQEEDYIKVAKIL